MPTDIPALIAEARAIVAEDDAAPSGSRWWYSDGTTAQSSATVMRRRALRDNRAALAEALEATQRKVDALETYADELEELPRSQGHLNDEVLERLDAVLEREPMP